MAAAMQAKPTTLQSHLSIAQCGGQFAVAGTLTETIIRSMSFPTMSGM